MERKISKVDIFHFMSRLFPLIFIILWSSAFITTKPIVDNSSPFAALCFRFLIVSFGFFLFAIFKKYKISTSKKNLFSSILSGILFHGIYLGGVFFSVSNGLPTNITALIVTLQPILTNILAGPFLNEKVTWRQWVGVLLGFFGAILVLGFDIGYNLPVIGIIAAFISLVSVTLATLWQKKISNNLPLPISNMYQSIGGFFFHGLIVLFFEKSFIVFNSTFIVAMSHQIFLVSFGAFSILMYLLHKGSASKTVTMFFLIPPTSAIMAWIFLNEYLSTIDLVGFSIATLGVYVATRKKN
jgi:drug/metabolite transporter (DMT)-like permease|tara:strand:+ start:1009 stop:1902 length:894 start_codon:yes stop_codon:yes gene_type:complete